MKIIFLDVDGVINTDRYFEKLKKDNGGIEEYYMYVSFDPEAMRNLKELVIETDGYIVISSSWRNTKESPILARWSILMEGLKSIGLIDRVIGETPTLTKEEIIEKKIEKEKIRILEIQKWLNDNKYRNITHFIILDDKESIPSYNGDNLVLCNEYEGFDLKKKKEALQILNS